MRAMQCLILAAPLVTLAACGPALESLRTRASFDMLCSEQGLTLTKVQSDAYNVAGCGQNATYVYVADSWVADPASFHAPFGVPAPAGPPLPMQPSWIAPPTWPPPQMAPVAMPPPPPMPATAPPPAAPPPTAPLR